MRVPSSGYASGAFTLLKPAPHIVILDELAPVGGGNATLHTFKESRPTFQYAGNGFLHHLGGVLALAGGELLKLRLGIGSEMDVHAF